MSNESRIWVYQASRKLSDEEIRGLTNHTTAFVERWTTHDKPLKASFIISHSQFLILAVDESFNKISGCSIDALVHFIRQVSNKLSILFYDHSFIAFQHHDEVEFVPFNQIKNKVTTGDIEKKSIFFDNSIQLLADFRQNWTKACQDSWMSKYF